MENRNQRGCRSVNKRGSSSGQACTGERGQAGGNRWGAGVFRAISRVARRVPASAARTTREKARDRHPAGRPVGPASIGPASIGPPASAGLPRLLSETSGHARRSGPGLPPEERLAVRAVATVLPFRTNSYVVENLIDWDAAPDDPIYRLVFPQPDMLPAADVRRLADLISGEAPAGRPARRRARDPDAAQPAPGRPAAAERAQPGRQAAARPAAQVPGDRAVLPPAGPDLPRVLHLLLPVGAVRGRARR